MWSINVNLRLQKSVDFVVDIVFVVIVAVDVVDIVVGALLVVIGHIISSFGKREFNLRLLKVNFDILCFVGLVVWMGGWCLFIFLEKMIRIF